MTTVHEDLHAFCARHAKYLLKMKCFEQKMNKKLNSVCLIDILITLFGVTEHVT
jgi:hypothetical protein